MRSVKQVLVVRKDLNMRKGKMCAQAAHASLKVILDLSYHDNNTDPLTPNWNSYLLEFELDKPLGLWLNGSFTKICVSVDSEQELQRIYDNALLAGIPTSLIVDNGVTEFHGVQTKTVVGIGPWWSDEIDLLTGHLKLL